MEAGRLFDSGHRTPNPGGLLKGKSSDTSTQPFTRAQSPPLHLAQRVLAFANMSHAKNSSPDVEALGKINRKGIERCGGHFPCFRAAIVAPETLELVVLKWSVRKNSWVALVTLGSRAEGAFG